MIKAAIMEVNPFHNGHKYFLDQIPKNNDDLLVVIISTTIVQRGEISILNKHQKSKLLLDNHADIVIALPALFANQGGYYFAYHSLRILSEFNIEKLYFGSETGDINILKQQVFHQTSDFKNGIYKHGNQFFASNDVLGVSYLQAITDLNLNIEPILIKRIKNNYNDISITPNQDIASATSIRLNQHNPDLIINLLPEYSMNNMLVIDEYLLLSLFKNNLEFCLDNNFNVFLSEDNQLLIPLKKNLLKHNIKTISKLAKITANKNNSRYKFQRIIINTILLIENKAYDQNYTFIHLLGFTKAGQKHIKSLNNKKICSSLKNTSCYVSKIEKRATNLFNIVTKQDKCHDYLPPIIKS